MVDGVMAENEAGDTEYKARTKEEMEQYLQLVQSAVGYNQERGDQIKVENIKFDRTTELLRAKELEREKQIDLAFQVGKYILGLIFVILFFTKVIKPMIAWMTTAVGPEEEETEEEKEAGMSEEQIFQDQKKQLFCLCQ